MPSPEECVFEELGGPPGYLLRSERGADPRRWLDREWLLANGAGGYAMGSVLGARTRRYHGLLIAHPPGRALRMLALASIVERAVISDGERTWEHDLSAFLFGGDDPGAPVVHPRGDQNLASFEKNHLCRWVYRFDQGPPVEIVKECLLVRSAPACLVRYTVRTPAHLRDIPRVRLLLRPLVALRDHHELLARPGTQERFLQESTESGAAVRRMSTTSVRLDLRADGATFRGDVQWWNNFFYPRDLERGEAYLEDLYSPGEFVWENDAGSASGSVTLQASLEEGAPWDFDVEESANRERIGAVVAVSESRAGSGLSGAPRSIVSRLSAAADDFVVRTPGRPPREPGSASVIAGYPWFSEWGRDTMICAPGLLLDTGRVGEALGALSRFARARRRGILPNVFNDHTGEPEYNTVDASLWFIIAACRYLRASGDRHGFNTDLGPACTDVVESYRRGTDFGIGMDPADYLIAAGTEATQLTWMDARRDGVVFTPRHGKPVEVCALWCSALAMLADAVAPEDARAAANLRSLAGSACASFRAAFWNEAERCCYDVLTPVQGGWRGSAQVRPNQLLGASLPHSPLRREQARAMLEVVGARLLTARGLRTLDPRDPGYRGRFSGSLFERDAAYHNGTVWPWLLGPYAEALMRTEEFSAASCARARGVLEPMLESLGDPCLGQISEVYDGDGTPDDPQRPGGCPAQAWSVAELLRVYVMSVRGGEG
jgi:predicted glycogen debranching enzyme